MVALARTDYPGGGTAPPLLVAHGLFGSGRNWGVICKRLSDRGPVVAVDMRNHGDSPHTDSHTYAELADDLAGVMDGRHDVLGHSMGGKAAMALALGRPDKVRRAVIVDIAPVAYDHSKAHLIAAMRALDPADFQTRRDADAAMAEHVRAPEVRAFLLQSLDIQNHRWKLNLDTLDAEMGRITGWPDDMTGRFDGPALFLSGETSDYVTPAYHDRIRTIFPQARFETVAGVGHWLHAERPREVEDRVRAFLDG